MNAAIIPTTKQDFVDSFANAVIRMSFSLPVVLSDLEVHGVRKDIKDALFRADWKNLVMQDVNDDLSPKISLTLSQDKEPTPFAEHVDRGFVDVEEQKLVEGGLSPRQASLALKTRMLTDEIVDRLEKVIVDLNGEKKSVYTLNFEDGKWPLLIV